MAENKSGQPTNEVENLKEETSAEVTEVRPGRRFRLTRQVKSQETAQPTPPPVLTREEREMQELAAMGDDADRGTPEQDASLRAGCTSFIRVIGLFFLFMFGSIILTMCIRR